MAFLSFEKMDYERKDYEIRFPLSMVSELVKNWLLECVWVKKNPDYRDEEETVLKAGTEPKCFGRFIVWEMFPRITIRLLISIRDLIFLSKSKIRENLPRRIGGCLTLKREHV